MAMDKSDLDDIHLSILNLSKQVEEMKSAIAFMKDLMIHQSSHSNLGISPLSISVSGTGLDTHRIDTPRSTACIIKTRNNLRRVSSTFGDVPEDRPNCSLPEYKSYIDMVTPLTPIHKKGRPLETSKNLFPSMKASIEGIGEETSSQTFLPQLPR